MPTPTVFRDLLRDHRIDEENLIESADGSEPQLKAVHVIGKNPDVDIGSEDMIDAGGDYPFPTEAQLHDIVSDSADDDGTSNAATETVTVTDPSLLLAKHAIGSIEVEDWTIAQGRYSTGFLHLLDWTKTKLKKATGTVTYGSVTYARKAHAEIVYNSPAPVAKASGTITYGSPVARAKATGTITFGTPGNGDTVSVDGHNFRKVAATPGANEFVVIADLTTLIQALSNVNATDDGSTITVVAAAYGLAGNAIVMSIDPENIGDLTLSGTHLTGGHDGDTVTVNGAELLCGDDFSSIGDLTSTIDGDSDLTATDDGLVITVVAAADGAAGNAIDMSVGVDNEGTLSVSDSHLEGGHDGDTVTVNGNTFTCVTGTPGGGEFSNITELTALVEGLASIHATQNAGVIYAVYDAYGTSGNAGTLSVDPANDGDMAVSGTNFIDGTAGDTITVDGDTYTAVTDTPSAGQFHTSEQLKVLIHAGTNVNATRIGSVITIEAAVGGVGGNLLAMSTDSSGLVLSGATLTDGHDNLVLVINGNTYTEGAEFTAVTSNALTATAIANALASDTDIDAGAVGSDVNIRSVVKDDSGDSIEMTSSDILALTVNGLALDSDDTFLTGGNVPLTITIGSTELVEGEDFFALTSEEVTGANLAITITNAGEDVSAVASNGTVNITADADDTTGNSIDLLTSNTDAATVSDSTLLGGVDIDILSIGDVDFTPGTDYEVDEGNAEVTAGNLRDAINDSEAVIVTALRNNSDVELTAKVAGTAANTTPVTNTGLGLSPDNGELEGGDDPSGANAFSVKITGLDADYNEIEETVILDGTTSVSTVKEYLRVNSLEVDSSANGTTNDGVITAEGHGDSTVSATILAGAGKAYTGVFTIPAGFSGFMVSRAAQLLATLTAITSVQVLTRTFPSGAWIVADVFPGNTLPISVAPPMQIEQKTDMRLRMTSASNNVSAIAQVNMLVVANKA